MTSAKSYSNAGRPAIGHWSLANRRSFVLVAVLIIVGSALYVATALLFQAQADVTSSRRAADIAQARALAWSGIQAVMNRLDEQRDRILAGQLPRLDDQYQIYETPGRLGVVRAAVDSGADYLGCCRGGWRVVGGG